MSIVDELIHLYCDEITGIPGAFDNKGTWVASGPAVTMKCRFEHSRDRRGGQGGQETLAPGSALVAGVAGFTPEGWRFTLPSRYNPHTNVQATSVIVESDEHGPVYEEVVFS